MGPGLVNRVRDWIADDPDPATRAELEGLLEREATAELAECFCPELRFGSAGLRGRLGAGPARVNRATVRRVSAGLAAYLLDAVPDAARAGVVIGHDARRGSAEFAADAARVLTGAGIRVLRLPPRRPTPLLAFGVRDLGTAAGIMVTASHNPPGDNGYKVYAADGAQIAPPVNTEIGHHIAAVGRVGTIPLGDEGEWLPDGIVLDYLRAIVAGLPPGEAAELPPLRIIYTPLHGVGEGLALAAFEQAGFPVPMTVRAQSAPDAEFPTVGRPNPEESGTLDLAVAQAQAQGADLVLANDPDADRLAVAIPTSEGWRVLTGDEVGALLADHLLRACVRPQAAVVVTTIASSSLLAAMAAEAGVACRETLTGFKWLMRAAAQAAPLRLLFAYDEALGYAVNDVVRDKDGISAGLVLRQAASGARQRGHTLADVLDAIAVRHGLHATRHVAIEVPDEEPGDAARLTAAMMSALRADPPRRLDGQPVTEMIDHLTGEPPRADVLAWHCGEDVRVVARPSGSEPRLKLYLEIVVAVHDGPVAAARAEAAQRLDQLAGELTERLTPAAE